MEFGRLEIEDLDSVDFTLPPDAPVTERMFKRLTVKEKTQVFVGCAKWGRKDWVGKIYPPKTKEADFLNHYARHFNCIELNATFYKMPTLSQTSSWASKVGKDFRFCPKFPNQITHLRRLKNVEELTDRFLKGISGFEETLGPLFLMPHPQLAPKDLDRLTAFIAYVPKDIKMFVEVRQPEWYSDPQATEGLFGMLESHQTGTVITDASGRRDCVHMSLTTPEVFIRFVGNGLHPTDYTRIDAWVQRIKSWMEKGIHRIYFFMHQHEEIHSPELSKYLIQQLNIHCGTSIPEPVFVEATVVPQETPVADKKTVAKKTSTAPKKVATKKSPKKK